jgi:hypothetical protein
MIHERRLIHKQKQKRMSETRMIQNIRSLISTALQYRPCLECKRHSAYPEKPPVTLHRGEICLICEGSLKESSNQTLVASLL